jgi:hypothetical protein
MATAVKFLLALRVLSFTSFYYIIPVQKENGFFQALYTIDEAKD